MYIHNATISIRQVKILLILQMFNMSTLMIPKIAAQTAGHDGYLLPLLAFVLGCIYSYLIVKVLERFPDKGLDTIAPEVLTRWVGWCVIALYVIKLTIGAGLEMRVFTEMVSQVLLPNTPIAVIIILMLFAVYYLIKSGIEATGRMAELLVYFVFIPLAFVLLLILIKPDYGQLLPLFQANVEGVLSGSYAISLTFMPLELILVIGAMVNQPNKVRRACITSIAIVSVIEVIIIALTYAGVGMVATSEQLWPVLLLMQSIQLPGSFLENQEILMMMCWILSTYLYLCGSLYVASLTLSRVFKFKRQNTTVLPLMPIVLIIAMIPGSLGESYTYLTNYMQYTGPLFLVVVPFIILIVAKIRGVGGKHE